MDQNQSFDQNFDNDLQRAIDNITNTTNTDPVFSDPVAAPSSVPEGDTGELGEPVGPFPTPAPIPTPMPEAHVEMVPPATEPIAPIDPVAIPDLGITEPTPFQVKPTENPTPAAQAASSEQPEQTALSDQPAPTNQDATTSPAQPEIAPQNNRSNAASDSSEIADTAQVKTAALRDLAPLLDRVDLDPAQKFAIYRDIFEDLKDYSALSDAYQSASKIADETERANALLYLVQSIDKM